MIDINQYIRKVPNWPKEGVLFYDVTTLFENKKIFAQVINELIKPFEKEKIDKVVGIDARGFVLAGVAAYKLSAGLSLVRKKGKLPYKTRNKSYSLEYATETIEMHEDTIKKGEKVLVVDDLVATGGTVAAAVELVEELGGEVIGVAYIIDLPFLGGADKLKKYRLHSLISYSQE